MTDAAQPANDPNAPMAEPTSPEAQWEAERATLREQNLRYLAEMENTRRRAAREREDAAKYAVAGFAKDVLTVADNLQRALAALPSPVPEGLRNLVQGIEATERQLLATLDRFGIKKIEALGKSFDPNLHQVMMELDDPTAPSGTVVQVLQTGYTIHDRLLREAVVGVSKGGAPTHTINTSA